MAYDQLSTDPPG
jgi:hypothetical protein